MYDTPLIREILSQILTAIGRIERRFSGISCTEDLISSDEGIDRLDGISMMLIAIGESCKNLDKVTGGVLLPRYPEVDWKGVKGIRDIISHHYFDTNAEIVYSVCRNHIPSLRTSFERMAHEPPHTQGDACLRPAVRRKTAILARDLRRAVDLIPYSRTMNEFLKNRIRDEAGYV